jgi:hypothetical protein
MKVSEEPVCIDLFSAKFSFDHSAVEFISSWLSAREKRWRWHIGIENKKRDRN